MKKNYIKPETEVLETFLDKVILATSGPDEEPPKENEDSSWIGAKDAMDIGFEDDEEEED